MDQILLLIGIGLIAGMLGSMIGIGGGIVIVPALAIIFGLSQHLAQGTSTATLLFPIGILAVYNYYKADAVNWKFAIFIALGFVLGGFVGSKIAVNLDGRLLKRIFAFVMLFVAMRMFWQSFYKS